MWNNRSPGRRRARGAAAPLEFDERMQFGRPRPGEQPVPGVGADRGDHRQPLGRVAETDRAHQPGDVGRARRAPSPRRRRRWSPPERSRRASAARGSVAAGRRAPHDPSANSRRHRRAKMVNMSASAQRGLCEFIDASPSPFHVCATVAAAAARRRVHRTDRGRRWPASRALLHGAGGLAGRLDSPTAPTAPFRIVGGHTDSPNLRVKQHPDRVVAGWRVVALEPYGGAWLNSWLDRDLGHQRPAVGAGRRRRHRGSVTDWSGSTSRSCGCRSWPSIWPRTASRVTLDPQRHVNAVWGVGERTAVVPRLRRRARRGRRRRRAGRRPDDPRPDPVDGWSAPTRELLSAPRLDNQATCYAGLEAFLAAEPRGTPAGAGAVRPRGGRLARPTTARSPTCC